MGREIRRVPENWQHPTYPEGHKWAGEYRPMFDRDVQEAWHEWKTSLREWYRDYDHWQRGEPGSYHTIPDIAKYGTYDEYAGDPPTPPNPYNYMPSGDWFQLFEDVSEGTPLSPPFATSDELIQWLTENLDFSGRQWSRESAESIVRTGWAPSFIVASGVGILEPHQMVTGDT